MSAQRPAAVLVLAAGEGTRMRSATPKVLHAIGGRTLLGHAVAAASGLRPEHLVVVVRHGRAAVVAHVDELAAAAGSAIVVADQDDRPGTGRAVDVRARGAAGGRGGHAARWWSPTATSRS